MRISTVAAKELSAAQISSWKRFQSTNSDLSNPHFCVELVQLVAQVRGGIEVAVLEDAGRPLGFLPYHRSAGDVARAVAGSFSNYQGIVAAADEPFEPRDVLPACGLSAWRFDHQLASQTPFQRYQLASFGSPYMDLSAGFDVYRAGRKKAGSNELQEALRKSRKLAREVGALRFEPDSRDLTALVRLVHWKREQLQARKLKDPFAEVWVLPLLELITGTRSQRFCGMLSTLHSGDQLLAVSLGMRCGTVMQGWISAFNRDYRSYSPGLVLIAELAQHAESLGIERIDMGRGNEAFKRSFSSGSTPLVQGVIDQRLVRRAISRGWIRTKEFVRGTAWDAPARRLVESLRYAVASR